MKPPFTKSALILNIIIFIWNMSFFTLNIYNYILTNSENEMKLILAGVHLLAAFITYYFILHKHIRYLFIKYFI